MATQSVVHSGVFRTSLAVQFMQPRPDLKTKPLAALAPQQIRDVRLGDADQHGNLVLLQAGRHQIGDDFFPHDVHNSICCCSDQQQPLVQHLLLNGQNAGMEIEEVRRLRLRQWIDNDPVSLGDVEKWCNHYSKLAAAGDGTLSSTYIRQLVPKRGNPSRNIGERVARRLERIVGKPKGSLDEDLPVEQGAAAPVERHSLAGSANNRADHVVAIDVVQNAVAGVLDAFGLRYEDLVGDTDAARARIEKALSQSGAARDVARTRFHLGRPGEDFPPSRATRVRSKKRFYAEASPDALVEEEDATERTQERRI